MRKITYLLIGILFGIVMTKSEAISWYRIQEMFRFQSFHMYGIIGVAVILGALLHFWLKKGERKDLYGQVISLKDKPKTYVASIAGGTLFGLGWAMTGACPGPLYVLLGHGYLVIGAIILSALLGTFVYGLLKPRLPH